MNISILQILFGGLIAAWFGHHTASLRAYKEFRQKKLEEAWVLADKLLWRTNRHWYKTIAAIEAGGDQSSFEDGWFEANREAFSSLGMISEVYFPSLKEPLSRVAEQASDAAQHMGFGQSDVVTMRSITKDLQNFNDAALLEIKKLIALETESIRKESIFSPFLRLFSFIWNN